MSELSDPGSASLRGSESVSEPGGSVRGERANFTRLVLGGGGGRPDYLQKLKVPQGYEKINDYSNI